MVRPIPGSGRRRRRWPRRCRPTTATLVVPVAVWVVMAVTPTITWTSSRIRGRTGGVALVAVTLPGSGRVVGEHVHGQDRVGHGGGRPGRSRPWSSCACSTGPTCTSPPGDQAHPGGAGAAVAARGAGGGGGRRGRPDGRVAGAARRRAAAPLRHQAAGPPGPADRGRGRGAGAGRAQPARSRADPGGGRLPVAPPARRRGPRPGRGRAGRSTSTPRPGRAGRGAGRRCARSSPAPARRCPCPRSRRWR